MNLVHEVDAVYKYMQEEQGVEPDQVTANAIVLALANANQPKKVCVCVSVYVYVCACVGH